MAHGWEKPFARFLAERRAVADDKARFYIHWVDRLLASAPPGEAGLAPHAISRFLEDLSREKEPWQIQQAREAMRLYAYFQQTQQAASEPATDHATAPNGNPWRRKWCASCASSI